MIRYLSRRDIVEINRRMTLEFGGLFTPENDNLCNPNSLNYILTAPSMRIFDREIYPDIFQKAAVYCFYIIKDHIFNDGNKRTGLESAFLFLAINQYVPKPSLNNDLIVKLALSIKSGDYQIDQIAEFFSEHFEKQ